MYAERTNGLRSSAIRDILKMTSKKGMISFAGGMPSSDLFPLNELKQSMLNVFSKYGPAALQYSLTDGMPELKEKIAAQLNSEHRRVSPQNILITHGSQQGLDLISRLYINENDIVITEKPTYLGALQPLRLCRATISPLPCDENGLILDDLNEVLRSLNPKLMYLMPNFQNPTGVSLSLNRRKAIVDLAVRNDIVIVEDDPYGNIHYSDDKLPTLFKLSGTGNFIYLSTFSKTIAPGFRVAYLAANEDVISRLTVIKQGTDLQTNTFGQYVLNEYLEHEDYYGHLTLLKDTYKHRRDCMLAEMKEHMPDSASWNTPGGGMFIWVELPLGINSKNILLKCLERNVAFVPGNEFFPDGQGENTMRLNFSNASPENIKKGIRIIGEVLKGEGIS